MKLQAHFAMKQTNICRLSGDIKNCTDGQTVHSYRSERRKLRSIFNKLILKKATAAAAEGSIKTLNLVLR